jgi:hypothetical protein
LATRAEVVAAARKWVGKVKEDPPGSNNTVINRWFGMPNAPYCAMGVSRVFHDVGLSKVRSASCDVLENDFRNGSDGELIPKTKPALPGDIAFYGEGADAQHVEIVVKDLGDRIQVVGFNTSPSASAGSQANGEGCWEKTRPKDSWLLHYGRVDGVTDEPRFKIKAVKVKRTVVAGRSKAKSTAARLRKKGYKVTKERIEKKAA